MARAIHVVHDMHVPIIRILIGCRSVFSMGAGTILYVGHPDQLIKINCVVKVGGGGNT